MNIKDARNEAKMKPKVNLTVNLQIHQSRHHLFSKPETTGQYVIDGFLYDILQEIKITVETNRFRLAGHSNRTNQIIHKSIDFGLFYSVRKLIISCD